MDSFNAMYRYQDTFYTGTANQPDSLSLFIKNNGNFLICHAEPFANILGKCVPVVGSLTGIARIVNAVKSIFENIVSSNRLETHALWNAFKNLFRGIVEVCPFSGIFLIMFDATRNALIIHSKIVKEIKGQQNIVGIAIDGKIICTLELNKVDKLINNPASDMDRLKKIKEICFQVLERAGKKQPRLNMIEIFEDMKNKINANS